MAQFGVIRGVTHKIMMFSRVRHAIAWALVGLGLYACAPVEPESTARAPQEEPAWRSTSGAPVGPYKVGTPYQINGTWYYPRVDYDYRETGIASWYGPGFSGKRTANGEIYNPRDLTAAHRTLPMPSVVRVTNLENGRTVKLRINDRGPFARSRIIDVSQRAAELLGFTRQGTAKVLVEIVEDESRRLSVAALAGEAARDAPRAAPMVAVKAEALPGNGAPRLPKTPAGPQTALAQPRDINDTPSVTGSPANDVVVTRAVRDYDIFVQAGAFTSFDNANRLRARLSALGDVRIAKAMVEDTQFFRVQLGPLASVDQADRLLELLLANGHNEARVVID